MSRPPSQAVIEAVERALIEHFGMESCGMGSVGIDACLIGTVWLRSNVAEVARAAETAALRVAAERCEKASPLTFHSGCRPDLIGSVLDHWADELTDTDDRSNRD